MQILDHGYVKLVETWGSDERIIEAARMSTQKGFEGWGGAPCPACIKEERFAADILFRTLELQQEAKKTCICKGSGTTTGDEKLLEYLWKNNHATPFEMAGMIIEVQAPIFIFREWHRHRTQSYNEASARYAPLPDLNYVPTVDRLMMSGGSNKQAQGSKPLTKVDAEGMQAAIEVNYESCQFDYEGLLADGCPKELARLVLPVGRYSKMRASANLRNWLSFLTLRADSKAQWEIQEYARAVADLVEEHFPRTYALFSHSK